MKAVIDTNILLISVSPKSKYRWVFDSFLNEKYELCVTTDILLEYEEVLARHMGHQFASIILQIIENAPNVIFTTRYFKWNLIGSDYDDNKFTDCAVAGRADYLITHDKHFQILSNTEFPKLNIIDLESFRKILTT